METLKALIPTLLTVSLGGLVLAVGLNAGRGDLLYVLRRPGELFKGVLAVIVIPPILAGILVYLLPLEPVVKIGIMLMAVSPVPPLVPGKQLGIGGRKEYAYGLYSALALLTIVSVPLVLGIASYVFGRDADVPFDKLFKTVFVGVVLPLGLGVLIRFIAPPLAARIWKPIFIISMVLVLAVFLPIVVRIWPALMALVGNGTVLAMAIVSAICLAVGHFLGGPDLVDRATLAVAASVRHPGIAMSIAGASFTDKRVSAAILLFMLVGMVVAIPYQQWVKRQVAAAAPAPARP